MSTIALNTLLFIVDNKSFIIGLIFAIIGIIFLILDNNSNFTTQKIISLTLIITSYLLIIKGIFDCKKHNSKLIAYIKSNYDLITMNPSLDFQSKQEITKGYLKAKNNS